jgi:large subunit ribosomal protein L18
VFRSNRYLSAQLINDESGVTIAGVSTRELSKKGTRTELAFELGKKIADEAKGKGVSNVVFDRGGYLYAGNIKIFADGAREGGLKF